MSVSWNILPQTRKGPTCVSFRAEKYRAFIVVYTEYGVVMPGKVDANFGPNEPTGAGDESFLSQITMSIVDAGV